MKHSASLLKLCMFFSAIYLATSGVSAQSIDTFSISASPEYPKEFQSTLITIDSFSTDLDRGRVIWKENGVVVADEVGLKERSFTAPKNGLSKKIGIEVITTKGFRLSKEYTLAPQAIDVLWEAPDSYVPPFYRGKALPGEEAVIRAVAIPNFTSGGNPVDRSRTVFNWSQNNTQAEESSGYGKSSFVFKLNPLKNVNRLQVTAGPLSAPAQVEETLNISPFEPQILFYESSPLLGTLYSKAFQTGLRLITNEVTLVAEPYSFSGSSKIKSSLEYSWSLNGVLAGTPVDPTRLTLRKPEGSGKSVVSLNISHPQKILQEGSKSISIIYGQ